MISMPWSVACWRIILTCSSTSWLGVDTRMYMNAVSVAFIILVGVFLVLAVMVGYSCDFVAVLEDAGAMLCRRDAPTFHLHPDISEHRPLTDAESCGNLRGSQSLALQLDGSFRFGFCGAVLTTLVHFL